MNWYKLAILMTEDYVKDKGLRYMDIGHEQFLTNQRSYQGSDASPKDSTAPAPANPEEMKELAMKTMQEKMKTQEKIEEIWVIKETEIRGEKKLQFTSHPAYFDMSHAKLKWEKTDSLAQGRFTRSKENPNGVCSMAFGDEIRKHKLTNPRRYEYMGKQVVKELERQYGPLVEILPYGNSVQ